ncbi:phage minor tail protein L [Stenotrophomonas sp. PUT21]|uniref:phage minor tail protein L n=1 Tax=Stenotrophomonas sp. PUT21 TaxID=3456954 RepID=UPI003FCE0350
MITADAQQLEPGGRVTVYELDASSFGADQLFFHQHLQTGVIWWQGQEYGAWPIEATGFERTSDQPPNPRLRVSNIDGRIGALCLMYDDMVGARIVRRQTLVKYLDAANFPPIVNLLNNSNNPAASNWSGVGTTTSALPAEVADGITFVGPALLTSGGANWHRRQAPLRGQTPCTPTTVRVLTVYFRYGTSNAARVVFNTNAGAGGANVESIVRLTASGGPVSSTAFNGPIDVLSYESVGGGVMKLVLQIRYSVTATSCQFAFGPDSGPAGRNVALLGMQAQDGSVATAFQATTNNPVYDRQPTADPNEHFLDEIWFIERKVSEDFETVEFELATAIDLNGEQLPGRQIIAGTCGWLIRGGYRGPYCTYNGSVYFDINDNPVSDPARDICAGLVRSCKKRFGENNPLPYGGFPAAGLLRT